MDKRWYLILAISLIFIIANIIIMINPNCPSHVDYAQYAKSVQQFYDSHVIDANVNGKFFYIYLMSILAYPFKNVIGILDALVLLTAIFQVLILLLFYRITQSLQKTYIAATTLTFLTFIGNPETAIVASFFVLLYFLFRDKPYSEFFITLAAFIRLDFGVYHLFARKRTAIIPILITFLQWLSNSNNFIDSDLGINSHVTIMQWILNSNNLSNAAFILFLSFGAYLFLIPLLRDRKNTWSSNMDMLALIFIILFMIIFLKFPSQKIFFFPVLLIFILFDLDFGRLEKYSAAIIGAMLAFNLMYGIMFLYERNSTCSAREFYEFADGKNIFMGTFQPYADYYGWQEHKPFTYQLSQNCSEAKEYFIAEDWRNPLLTYNTYQFCAERT